jgi:hypothetical protein
LRPLTKFNCFTPQYITSRERVHCLSAAGCIKVLEEKLFF